MSQKIWMLSDVDVFAPFYITFDGAKQYHLAALSPGGSLKSACRMTLFEDGRNDIALHERIPFGFARCPVCFKARKKFIEKHFPGCDYKPVMKK